MRYLISREDICIENVPFWIILMMINYRGMVNGGDDEDQERTFITHGKKYNNIMSIEHLLSPYLNFFLHLPN